MKRILLKALFMMLIMMFAGASAAQQLVGESDTFIFDTRHPVIPLSNSVLLIFFILAGSLIFYRYYFNKKKAVL